MTRIQIWYRDRKTNEYEPGRIVPFNSELIPGIIEGLVEVAHEKPQVTLLSAQRAGDPVEVIQRVLQGWKLPMHWEALSDVLEKEHPDLGSSKWTIYNCLLSHPALFTEVEEDVFQAAKTK